MDSYKVLWLCHRLLTPRYRLLVADMAASKRVHHVRSLLAAVEHERWVPDLSAAGVRVRSCENGHRPSATTQLNMYSWFPPERKIVTRIL